MPLPKEFYNRNQSHILSQQPNLKGLYPTFDDEEEEDDGFSLLDALGSGLHHFISAGTLGLSEFAVPTKGWDEKGTDERIGAALGEALGMFLPMGWIGKGASLGMQGLKHGSKAIAKNAINKSVSKINNEAIKSTVQKGLTQTVFSKEGKRLLFQHELGGDIATQVNRQLMDKVETDLISALGAKGIKVTPQYKKKVVDQVMKSFKEGLADGEHLNTVSSWLHKRAGNILGTTGMGNWVSKYIGEVGQDAVVLGLHGILHNGFMAAAREDTEFAPGTTLGHALALSFVFPLIRSIPGGGERKFGEGWNVLTGRLKKTDYKKLVKEKGGAEDLRTLLGIMGRNTVLSKNSWKLKSTGKTFHLDQLKGLDLKVEKNVDDLLDLAEQMRNSISRLDGLKMWGKGFMQDTLNLGTLSRMSLGAAAMNIDMFKQNMAGFRNLPPEEVLTHILIGAFMTRGRGGWARDPQSRTGDAKAKEINNYYELMGMLGIEHSKVSDYLKVKNLEEYLKNTHMGIKDNATVKEIIEVYNKYEKLMSGRLKDQSKKEVNDIIEEYHLLRMAHGFMGDKNFSQFNYNLLTPTERKNMRTDLESIVFKDKPLKESSYQELMREVEGNQGEAARNLYHEFLLRLRRDSEDGAGDRILDVRIDGNGIIRHGGVKFESEYSAPGELYNFLKLLEQYNLAVQDPNVKRIDLSDKNSPQSIRLERVMAEFKKTQNRLGLGEGVDFQINLGDPDNNPYLRLMINGFLHESQRRNADLFTDQIKQENQKDSQFYKVLVRDLTDNGKVLRPENITIKVEEGVELPAEIVAKFEGIKEALYSGAKSYSGDSKEVPLDKVQQIVSAYESMNLGSAETLLDRNTLRMISSQADANLNISPHAHRTIRHLDEHGLIGIDRENGIIRVNSEQSIRQLANEAGIDQNKAWNQYRDILELLPQRLLQVEKRGPLEFALDQKVVSIEQLNMIYKTIPEIYNEQVRKDIIEVIDSKSLDFNEKQALEQLDLLETNLKAMNYDEAFNNLKNLADIVPGFNDKTTPSKIRFDRSEEAYRIQIWGKDLGKVTVQDVEWSPNEGISRKDKAYNIAKGIEAEMLKRIGPEGPINHYESLLQIISKNKEQSNLGLSLEVFEYSKGSGNVYEAIKRLINKEKESARLIEEYLGYLVYKGSSQRFAAVNDHARLVDNLNALLNNQSQKVSLNSLFENYLQGNNTYTSLKELMTGLHQVYSGRSEVNLLDSQNLMNSYHRMMQNATDMPTKTRITIGNKYGLLDADNGLHPRVIELLKKGDFDALKQRIPNELKGDDLESDLAHLSWVVNSSVERKAIIFTEKLVDGNLIGVTEWVHPSDNPAFQTPGGRVIDKLNAMGIEVIQIKKAGVINRRFINDISSVEGVKDLFESNKNIDLPNDKYLHDIVRKGGELTPRDENTRRLVMGDGKSGLRFVEISFGAPIAFRENTKTKDALNKGYSNWYTNTLKRYNNEINNGLIDPARGRQLIANFKAIFNPKNVASQEVKLRALYLANLNSATFDLMLMPKAIANLTNKDGHYDLAMSLLKYSKLAEGGSLKPIPDVYSLEQTILKLGTDPKSKLPMKRIESIERLINDLKSPQEGGTGRGIRYGFYADEAPGNPLLVRQRALIQHNESILNPILREYSLLRYGDKNRFKDTMDQSVIDGAQFIDKDMRNLMLTLMAEGGEINGFKGSIARGATDDSSYILFGKGLFIYDPQIANSMESRGIRFLMGNSSAKAKKGFSLEGTSIKGRVATETDFARDIANLGDGNIMQGTLEGVGLRFSGHISANSPVPHPYTHFMPKDLVIGIREGWMGLHKTIDSLNEYSSKIKDVAKTEVANMLRNQSQLYGPTHELDMPSFAENMLNMGFTTRNEVVRKAVIKMFEEQTLPTLFKPRNPKFAYPLLMPDLKAKQPLSLDVYKGVNGIADGNPVGAVRIQLGEATIGADAMRTPVHSARELVYSIRVGDVDYIIKYGGKGKYEAYTHLRELQKEGEYVTDIKNRTGDKLDLKLPRNRDVKIPKEVKNFIEHLEKVIEGTSSIPREQVHTITSGKNNGQISFEGVQRLVEQSYYRNKYDLKKNNFSLISLVERGPRKGRSDFIPARIRIRSEGERLIGWSEIGTLFGLNPYDARANAQADWDGDKVRYTYDFGDFGKNQSKWKLLKQAFRESSMNEEYNTLETPIRETNIFGISFGANGKLQPAGSQEGDALATVKRNIVEERMAIGKVIGLQSGLEYASLLDISIDGQKLNERIGYSNRHIMEFGDMYRRWDKASQSAVDFIKGINEILYKDPYGYYFYGDGENRYKGQVFDFGENNIRREIFNEVIDVLRKPSSIFNQVWSEGGANSPTSFNIQREYVNLLKFLNAPNATIINRLITKWKNNPKKYNLNEKLNQLVPLFFKTEEGMKPTSYDLRDLKRLALDGKVKHTNNVIKFGKGEIQDLLKRANVGYVMDAVVKNDMYKVGEIDYAWSAKNGKGIRDLAALKEASEILTDEISLYRTLGISTKEMHENATVLFTAHKQKYIQNAEMASIMHGVLTNESRQLEGFIESLSGHKNPRKDLFRDATARLLQVEHAMRWLEEFRGIDILNSIKDTQDTYVHNFKNVGKYYNGSNKEQVIYKITGKLYDADGNPNFKALKYFGTVGSKRSTENLSGKYLILKNPIIAHRLSRERTLDGYAWHYTYNNIPAFTTKVSFNQYTKDAAGVRSSLSNLWYNSIRAFKSNKSIGDDIFENLHTSRRLILNDYFNAVLGSEKIDQKMLVHGFDADQSFIYYKAKMLLRPEVVPRHYIPTETVDLAYMKLNQKVFENVFTWLHENGHTEIGAKIASEYNGIKDFISGMTNQKTFKLRPSPLYTEKYTIPEGVHRETFLDMMQGIITPDLELKMLNIGASTYEVETKRQQEGEFSIRHIRSQFEKWNEFKYDKRKENLCGGG